MWPFKPAKPVIKPVYTEELVRDTAHTILGSDEIHHIRVGLSTSDTTPGIYRVFYMMDDFGRRNLRFYPRQSSMNRERALVVAEAWSNALEVTFLQSMDQNADNDRSHGRHEV